MTNFYSKIGIEGVKIGGKLLRKSRLNVSFLTVLMVFTMSLNETSAKCPVRMGSLFPPKQFLVISQRGSSNFQENTLAAFQEAINKQGANSLQVDLILNSKDRVVLSRNSAQKPDTKPRVQKPQLKDFLEWASQQPKLKLVLFNLNVPANDKDAAIILLKEFQRVLSFYSQFLQFEMVFLTPHKEILKPLKSQFKEFDFSYYREIRSVEIINYHTHTSIPTAMEFKNDYSSIGLKKNITRPSTPDPWKIYKFILTLDFKIRDNYKKSTGNYIKIFSGTFNDARKIRCLINLGVNGIVTNHPDRVKEIALELGKTLD
ncbi:MAG: hypothetical protein VW455_06815 [Nitrospinota bacterium]